MAFFPASLDNLIDRFASLPGIGRALSGWHFTCCPCRTKKRLGLQTRSDRLKKKFGDAASAEITRIGIYVQYVRATEEIAA